MKIAALRLFNVRRFAGRGVAIEGIGDGINVLCAANEAGKSTSFEALQALFLQPHTSRAGDVQNLRPYSGGNPLVEADIVTAAGRFRISKQFLGGRSARVTELGGGRVVAQADEAEAFIAAQIGGGTTGPAGLLWVRQGLTGLERRRRPEAEGERELRRSLLESVQGEVEAVTGGQRLAAIMAEAQAALEALVTSTGRPRTGGPYAAAIAERDRLAAEERALGEAVAALRDALDQRAAAARRLAELESEPDEEERRQAVLAAEAALDAARARSETLRAAAAELTLAEERRALAGRDLEAFRAALAQAAALRTRLGTAGQRRQDALDRRRAARAAMAEAQAAAETAARGEQEARAVLARLDTALRAREAAERLARMRAQLQAAEEARQRLEQGEARLALLALPAGAVDALQDLDVEIAGLRATAEAARASVAIRYEAAVTAVVSMDGTPLSEGEERGYDRHARLAIPGVGTITLRADRPAPGDDRLRAAEAERRAHLSAMGVDDLAAARARQVAAQRLSAELGEERGRLSQLAPEGLARLREAVTAAAALRAGDTESLELKADPEQGRAALAAAGQELASARLALAEREPLRAAAEEAFVAAETALAALRAEATRIDAVLGPEAGRREREQSLMAALAVREQARAEAAMQVEALQAATTDLEAAQARLARVRSVAAAAATEAAGLRETIAGLNAAIRTRADEAVEEKWAETAEALTAATARLVGFEREVAILRRLVAALDQARSEARDLYLKPVMAELTPLLGLLFDDVAITFDDKTLLPRAIRRNGQEEEVERLSGGMREQLSVLTRLAFARLLARDGRPAPVILDDALVYSDDDRIETMFDALHRQSRDQQIIVFSCRQRAFQRLGGTVLEMTDWQP